MASKASSSLSFLRIGSFVFSQAVEQGSEDSDARAQPVERCHGVAEEQHGADNHKYTLHDVGHAEGDGHHAQVENQVACLQKGGLREHSEISRQATSFDKHVQ